MAPHRGRPKAPTQALGLTLGLAVPMGLVAGVPPAWALGEQDARLRGTVIEANTGAPMSEAKVELVGDAMIGGPRRTQTDEAGSFDFTVVPPGRYLLARSGSDKFTIDSSFYLNHEALSLGSRAGTQIYEGKLLDQSDPAPAQASYQANVNIGGADRLPATTWW